ncbi:MAG: RNA polymerase subunit sigma-24 [Clostridiales bacterium]|nr:RNA polymerase subunit sigma-24 [Clostridiales bacterium]
MINTKFAQRIEQIRMRLYKTALLYLGSETPACDAVDETVYKALKNYGKLRQPEYFDTWITRILINECHNERRRQKWFQPLAETAETLQIPKGTAATRQRRALQLLRLELGEEESE